MSEAEQSRDTTPGTLQDADREVAGADAKRSDAGSATDAGKADKAGRTVSGDAGARTAAPDADPDAGVNAGVADGAGSGSGSADGADSAVGAARGPVKDAAPGTTSGTGAGRAAGPGVETAAPGAGSGGRADSGRTGGGTVRGAVKAAGDGRLLAGRYRLGGVLGRGGMGTVWRAVDETLGRTVAVKELRFPNSIDEDEKRRLITRTLREAKAIARIRNNGAVTVYDVVDEDDRPWIVMELVEGKSLAEALREDGLLTPRRAAEVGLAILDVLRSAHREGILHRDVKPSNVLIAEDGRVVLTDFGIAQVEGDPSITSTGMLVGAPSYISPERARGHKPGPAADLWSLGGLLYACVEGCPPYDKGSAIATLTAVMTEPLDPPKNAGPLEEVIYGLLAKDPAQRLDDAGARALLLDVMHAPEHPAAPEPSAEATRVVALPPVPPEPVAPAAAPAKDAAAVRLRSALRSVRNAAAKTEQRPASPEPAPSRAPGAASARTAPVRAPLTDVVSRRMLVVVAVVVALAVLSTVLLLALNGNEDKGGQGKPKGDTAASAGAASGGNGQDKDKGDTQGGDSQDQGGDTGTDDGTQGSGGSTAGAQPSGDGKTGGQADVDGIPAGYELVTNDRFHFTMAMPKEFKLTRIAGQNSGGVFSVNGGFPRVQVDFTNSPGGDARLAWARAVDGVRAGSDGYKHLGIDTVEYNGYPTVADWSFERIQNGERIRVLNRGFKVDAKHGYAIMISCKASEWDGEECATLVKTAFGTFAPKD
ncbi:protein kinase [Streptomyces sp. NPDC002133]|uniref:serine/threonine-protein kinase n=1 Tax=Streptomyces sp. NPDC002133 TaxID=3154409 RepID=UPI0033211167